MLRHAPAWSLQAHAEQFHQCGLDTSQSPFYEHIIKHQQMQLHWWHWHNYHLAVRFLAQHSLQWYRLSGQNMSPRNSGKEKFNNNNNILYSTQREIKAVVRSHNEEHNNYKPWNTRTYTLLDKRPLSPSLCILIANPKLHGIMLSLSNQNVKKCSN